LRLLISRQINIRCRKITRKKRRSEKYQVGHNCVYGISLLVGHDGRCGAGAVGLGLFAQGHRPGVAGDSGDAGRFFVLPRNAFRVCEREGHGRYTQGAVRQAGVAAAGFFRKKQGRGAGQPPDGRCGAALQRLFVHPGRVHPADHRAGVGGGISGDHHAAAGAHHAGHFSGGGGAGDGFQLLADTNNILSETASSIQAVKAFTNELFEINRYRGTMKEVVTRSMSYAKGRAIFSVFIISILFGALFFIVWQGAYMVSTGAITAGQLVAFVSYTAIIGGAIAGLGSFYAEILGAIGATERIMEILNEKPEQETIDTSRDLISAKKVRGSILFDQVRFRYPSRTDIEVLKGLTFSIRPGERIALVGQSGAGKSTVMQLLLRFFTDFEGSITLDGKPIEDYELNSYRKQMAIVPQEVLLFGGSIRENILYGKPEATESEIISAAQKANALDFINSFPEGLDTMIGERGVKLSGGQKQRIAIARAILKDPVILLLDEATSSLDAESEKIVQDALNNLMEGRTSLIIAHRLATIREADKILVLDQGRIIETGTHAELSAIKDGAYSNLAKLQFETATPIES
jgi:ABC-type multidrug transport system fused ATPase/permease subunit